MASLSVAEAAEWLGVNVQRVHQRIADGSLRAEKVGHQWQVEDADLMRLDRRGAGRPVSARSAALVIEAAARDGAVEQGSPSERARARSRLRGLVADARSPMPRSELAARIRHVLQKRADRRLFSAPALDLADLRADSRLDVAGLSSDLAGMAAPDHVEGYVRGEELEHLVHDFLLVEAPPARANVVLHVRSPELRGGGLAGNALVVAADLAEYHRPREDARAAQLVRDLDVDLSGVGRIS